jgi:adenine C2-methylase RlmN of 23S rRNA A2503 and tRNA A37
MRKIKQQSLSIYFSFITLLFLTACSQVPTDSTMIENFNEHKAAFKNLVKMIKHDKGVNSISIDTYDKNDIKNISGKRLNKYQRILQNIGASSIKIDSEHKYIILGYYGSKTIKKYVYTEDFKPHPIFKSLDKGINDKLKKEKQHQAYRHIEGNWYIQYTK